MAVVTAASAAATGSNRTVGLLLATWLGLTASDGWKYWAGRLAHRIPAAARMAQGPRVQAAREKVLKHLALTIIVARFVPGTRIPINVACGVFHAPFLKYISLIMFTGAIYIGLTYALFRALGEVVGEEVRANLPFIVLPIVIAVIFLILWRSRQQQPAA